MVAEHPDWSLNGSDEEGVRLSVEEGAAVVRAEGEELHLLSWAAAEDRAWALMDLVVAEAWASKCTRVRGEFVATGKNDAMREYLAQFGFTMIGEDERSTLWVLPVSAYEPAV